MSRLYLSTYLREAATCYNDLRGTRYLYLPLVSTYRCCAPAPSTGSRSTTPLAAPQPNETSLRVIT